MNSVYLLQIRSRSFHLQLVLVASALCFHSLVGQCELRADDYGDLGTLKGTPSKAGPPNKKPARNSPQYRPSNSRTKPRSRPPVVSNNSNTDSGRKLTGTWLTTDGWTVRLKQVGSQVTGTYAGTGLTGTMRGSFNGSMYRGNFSHHQGSIAFTGQMNLAYSPANETLTGRWNAGSYSEPITANRVGR